MFTLLGVAQSLTRTTRAAIFVLMALANPAMAISVVDLVQFHLPVNALYLLILFGFVPTWSESLRPLFR